MGYVVAAAICVGLVGGSCAGYAVSQRIVAHLAQYAQRPVIVRVSGVLGGLVIFLPAAFLAFAVGGNLGGGWGARLLSQAVGVPLGMALGMAAVLAFGLIAGATAGAGFGAAVSLVLGRTRAA